MTPDEVKAVNDLLAVVERVRAMCPLEGDLCNECHALELCEQTDAYRAAGSPRVPDVPSACTFAVMAAVEEAMERCDELEPEQRCTWKHIGPGQGHTCPDFYECSMQEIRAIWEAKP